jgi:hypothetical protein
MSRVPPARLSALASVVIVAALAVGACQSAPPTPELTDPNEILAAAVTTTASASSVRIDATADGDVALDLGLGTPSDIALAGTTVSADLDIEAGDARATFSAPNLLGITGELIVVDGTSYVKTSLTGPNYIAQPIDTEVSTPSGATSATFLQDLTGFLANPALDPTKGEDVACGKTTCYRVQISLTPDELAALGAGDLEAPPGLPVQIPIPDLTDATVDLAVLVAKDTTRLAGLEATIEMEGGTRSANVDVTFSKWDEDVSISAPPADQVTSAP